MSFCFLARVMNSEFRGADPAEGCRLDAGDACAEPSAVFIRRAEVATLYYSTTVRNPKARLGIRVEKAMRLSPVPCHSPIRLFPTVPTTERCRRIRLAVMSAVGTCRHPSHHGYEGDVLACIDCGSVAGRPPQ
jgi:hypothetical protein